ncbi:glutathione S-transferase C-terminal domain-containing protein [Burkholderia cenocepacia]|uniref:glutathione S-transferase family protein n=1 Tax=Burkholderia cenocepacia TaxID=95486 RepID=UPI00196B384A|nr:glutathione S-transferase C-terminal domain-containing protein [Burkholderia cenocepacia]MBN3534289.1 glutathione S-transferase C-terminal domain-containing protein [Burkholderia cenocepacia]MBR8030280.1 glutathione S-transferase C-terminal domain-containing protein [Burkholderia cenocepacia]MBR8174094.1 glutathione S-transferase C-terminal domain-containing protein [Burkholderia cenocepacia]MBR8428789.1 glutathione S-transferase C-terminal domain-containing protein [Burkholderia cenocepacia
MKHTLYYSPGACSLAVHIALEWVGATYIAKRVRPQSPKLTALSPSGAVPVLQRSDGWVLSQAGAILHYIARQFPDAGLGSDGTAEGEAEFDRWSSFFTGDLHPAFFPLFSPERYTTSTDSDQLEHVRAAARNLVRKRLALLDGHLKQSGFVLSGRRTLLDAYAFPMLRWAEAQLPERLADFAHVESLNRCLAEDPLVRKIMQEEAIA